MRILWLKVGGLWPVNTGGRRRSFEIVSELSRRHPVSLLTTHAPGDDPAPLRQALPRCALVNSLPHALAKAGSARFAVSLLQSWLSPLPVDLWKCRLAALRERARLLLESGGFDVCVADFLAATPNLPSGSRTPILLFEHNVEHLIWKRLCDAEKRPLRRALLELEWRKMRRYEAQACARAGKTLAVSEDDRSLLAAAAPGARVAAIPTGVDIAYFAPRPGLARPCSLVFTGAMDWYPNEEALLHFIAESLPLIRREFPQVSLTIVGRNPTPRLRQAAGEARVTGTVDDVRPYIAEGAVYVVPLRIGGGTRLKIFEALAMGRPVVSTTLGAEGLPLTPGRHFLQADGPVEFARAVVSLLRDPERRSALGAEGRRLVEEKFSWAQVARTFETELAEVASHAD